MCADFVVGVFLVVCGNDNRFATHSSRRRISLSLVTVSGQKRSLNHSCRSGALQAYCWPHEMVIPVLFVAAPSKDRVTYFDTCGRKSILVTKIEENKQTRKQRHKHLRTGDTKH